MLARTIHSALTQGWSAYLGPNSQVLFEDLFGRVYELSDTEVTNIGAYFRSNPPKINHGFPRDSITTAPAIFLYTLTAQQPNFALNDFGGFGAAPTTPSAQGYAPGSSLVPGAISSVPSAAGAAFILSSLWQHTFQIMTLARGGPERIMYCVEINKSILLAAKNYFLSKAIQSVALQTSEVQFRDDLSPSDLFAASITMQCGREFSQADTSQSLQDAFKLPGLIGPPGSDSHHVGRPPARISVEKLPPEPT